MKKLVALLLCLSLVLLTGCQMRIFDELKDMFQLDTIVPPAGSEDNYHHWNVFQWECKTGKSGSVTLTRSKDDGNSEDVVISFDGQNYSITDSAGTRTYAYLISSRHTEKSGSGYRYGDYFFLTDDPNMTFEKYQKAVSSPLNDHMQLLLPTELVFGKSAVAEDVVCYGQVPKGFDSTLSSMTPFSGIHFEERSFFLPVVAGSGSMRHHLIRFDYAGKLLSTSETPLPQVYAMTELADGGFCAALSDGTAENKNSLLRFNEDGKFIWQYDFPANRDVYLRYIFQTDGALYCFGTVDTDPSADTTLDDLYFAIFSMDGALLQERLAGGTDFEKLNHVTISNGGFTVYAATQSKDGDFPFSEDGYYADFQVQLSKELELSKAEVCPKMDYIVRHYGYHNGAPVYPGDQILTPHAEDQLPEKYSTVAIFAQDDGYVILRCYALEGYLFSNPYMSYRPVYRQLIATYYDAAGKPVWQTVSEPFLQQ